MEENFSFEVWAGFALLFCLSCVLGNSLLLVSVLYAKYKNRHNFHGDSWIPSTIGVLNLAVADICYCLIYISNGVLGILAYQKYDLGKTYGVCKFMVLGKQNMAMIDGWCTAALAFNTAFPKIW